MGQVDTDAMNFVQKLIDAWKTDTLTQKVIRNTGYLFSSNTVAMLLGAGQGLLAAFLLGPAGYGVLGLVITLATSMNRLFSFRMGEIVIKYAGQDLVTDNQQRAAAVVKAAFFVEGNNNNFGLCHSGDNCPMDCTHIHKRCYCNPMDRCLWCIIIV